MSSLNVNTINEYTSANGVTIDGVLIKDNTVDSVPEIDQWHLTSDRANDNSVITANLSRFDDGIAIGYSGTGMTESSGIFSFPSTGHWLIMASAQWFNASADERYVHIAIKTTEDNSSYSDIARASAGLHDTSGSNVHENASEVSTLVDVTNTSNVKVKFEAQSINNTTTVKGNSTQNETFFTFIRLGDT